MEKLDKVLRKFSEKERKAIILLVEKILSRNLVGLDSKKLRGVQNFFRVRKGDIRIIFELGNRREPNIISIDRKNESTYRF